MHVAHAVIDGVIDIPRTKGWKVEGGVDAKISADAVSLFSPFPGPWSLLRCGFIGIWDWTQAGEMGDVDVDREKRIRSD